MDKETKHAKRCNTLHKSLAKSFLNDSFSFISSYSSSSEMFMSGQRRDLNAETWTLEPLTRGLKFLMHSLQEGNNFLGCFMHFYFTHGYLMILRAPIHRE